MTREVSVLWGGERIHGFRVGDVQEVHTLGLEAGKGCHREGNVLNVDQATLVQHQVPHHLWEERHAPVTPSQLQQ